MEKSIRKIMFIVLLIILAVGLRFLFEYGYNLFYQLLVITPWVRFLTRGLMVLIVLIVWLSVTLRSDYPHQKLPWLLILFFEPVVGIFLFLSLGRGFKNSLRYKRRPLIHDNSYITKEKSSEAINYPTDCPEYLMEVFKTAHRISYHQPFFNTTTVEVLENGELFYPDMLSEIKQAKIFIFVQFYIVRSDHRGKETLELLMQKAHEGLKVKLIIDAVGSVKISRKLLKKLKNSPVDLIVNDPIYFPFFNTRINYRNHRKIIVIDGKIGYTGGMNLADEYDNNIAFRYFFRDTQIKLQGEAVKSLTAVFLKDYYYNTGKHIDEDFYYPKHTANSKGITQIIQSGPESNEAHIRNVYLKMIFTARRSIRIMTPYMAMDQEMLTALKVASQSGIDVEIIIPGTPDRYLVYKVTKYFASKLIDQGVKVYQYTKGFCHAKILIIDDVIASVGSYNLDNRSAVIDFEVSALFMHNAVDELIKGFAKDKTDSTQIDPESWKRRPVIGKLIESVMSLFTPIL